MSDPRPRSEHAPSSRPAAGETPADQPVHQPTDAPTDPPNNQPNNQPAHRLGPETGTDGAHSADSTNSADGGARSKVMNEEDRAPWGLTIRVSFYLVGVHIFAAFLFLLFQLGAK
ncbi:DUF6126 family protein [Streptomyces zagrosensis]|uniref:Small hydrophobic protein n=1 Tax=Streptomyces zagrosensis TaxID=1042984 RepID=A0A7W9QA64_9ACTN|nr:DUF6126 family protein [Streptomyces zagrosensis]MBB5936219.1 hypothetical protein [Streptomyces zagrosensis]